MDMRITPQTMFTRQMSFMRRQTAQLAIYQEQVGTGIKLVRPSDDPIEMMALMAARSDDDRLAVHRGNVNTASARLNQANSQLLETTKLLSRARAIALEGANAATDSPGQSALAEEVDTLLNQMLGVANSQDEGRYVFGGTANGQAPFSVTSRDAQGRILTVSYQGSSERASLPVGRDHAIDVVYSGEEIYQQPTNDVFAELAALRDELLNTGNAAPAQQSQALSQRAGNLENAQRAILDVVGEMSSTLESLESMETRLGDVQVQVKSRVSDLESADLAEAVVGLKTQETLFGNTLAVSARLFDLNLLDFLR
jgi:flagellar hook-associated protein 3 FlgL